MAKKKAAAVEQPSVAARHQATAEREAVARAERKRIVAEAKKQK